VKGLCGAEENSLSQMPAGLCNSCYHLVSERAAKNFTQISINRSVIVDGKLLALLSDRPRRRSFYCYFRQLIAFAKWIAWRDKKMAVKSINKIRLIDLSQKSSSHCDASFFRHQGENGWVWLLYSRMKNKWNWVHSVYRFLSGEPHTWETLTLQETPKL
jgi:hypothetical protein